MLKNILLAAAALLFTHTLVAQEKFIRNYTISGDSHYAANYGAQTLDGGYFITGARNGNSGYSDMTPFAGKLDANGNWIWLTEFNDSSFSIAASGAVCSDGGYLITGQGYVFANAVSFRCYIVKLDENGTELWAKSFESHSGLSAIECADGNYLITAMENSTPGNEKINLMKIEADGTLVWFKQYLDPDQNLGPIASYEAPNGDIVICGFRHPVGNFDNKESVVMRTDSLGNLLWMKEYSEVDELTDLVVTESGQILAVGKGEGIAYLHLDVDGSLLAKRFYLGNMGAAWGGVSLPSISITLSEQGEPMISGFTDDRIFLMKTNISGVPIWARTYDGVLNLGYAVDLVRCQDNGYLLLGQRSISSPGICLVKTNSVGVSCEFQSTTMEEFLRTVIVTDINASTISELQSFPVDDPEGQAATFYTEHIQCMDSTNIVGVSEHQKLDIAVFPNPFSETITISSETKISSYTVTNSLAQRVNSSGLRFGAENKIEIKVNGPSGIYFLHVVTDGNKTGTLKIMKE